MSFHYQVGLLGTRPKLQAKLVSSLRSKFKELGIPREDLVVLKGNAAILSRDRKSPFALVFFGSSPAGSTYDNVLDDVLADSVPTFPVVSDLQAYSKQVPHSLSPINGIEISGTEDVERLANFVLEAFRLLRATRRLFISYRRAETQAVAIQLYEELDSRSFDVFLDTHSVSPGEPFQKVLWHRLADTDIVVLLESPHVGLSKWTMDELAQANATNVQVLQVVWPEVSYRLDAAFSEKMQLEAKAFTSRVKRVGPTARLTKSTLREVCKRVESLRARALAARYAYLVDQFCDAAQGVGLRPIVQQGRSIDVVGGRKFVVAIPGVGVPNAELTEQAEKTVLANAGEGASVWIVYDERGILDLWVEHLRWLNSYVTVKTVQVSECEDELRKLAK